MKVATISFADTFVGNGLQNIMISGRDYIQKMDIETPPHVFARTLGLKFFYNIEVPVPYSVPYSTDFESSGDAYDEELGIGEAP